ncbi:hypothetical protein ABVK25_007332 [Lepraria finkii]|uniref:Uncharacterized protein n=1 Tax=Lepraria finkii TaxID=1340010 RepID=A0ABR4B3I5_9LECA
MASPLPSGGSSTPKRHSRNISINRAPLARPATKGPLDIDDPLAPGAPPTQDTVTAEAANTPVPTTPFSPERPVADIAKAPQPVPAKDFSYLLRPEIYHPLSQLDLPPPFRTPIHQPAPSAPPSPLSSHTTTSAPQPQPLLSVSAPCLPLHRPSFSF